MLKISRLQHLSVFADISFVSPHVWYSQLIAYFANRAYHSFENIDFLNGPERRRTKRLARLAQKYEATATDDIIPLVPYSDKPVQGPGYTDVPYRGPVIFAERGWSSWEQSREWHCFCHSFSQAERLFLGLQSHYFIFVCVELYFCSCPTSTSTAGLGLTTT